MASSDQIFFADLRLLMTEVMGCSELPPRRKVRGRHESCFRGRYRFPKRCRRFCSCESTRLQQSPTDFNKQGATTLAAITWNQQNSTDFNKFWNLVRDQLLDPEILLGSPLHSAHQQSPLFLSLFKRVEVRGFHSDKFVYSAGFSCSKLRSD